MPCAGAVALAVVAAGVAAVVLGSLTTAGAEALEAVVAAVVF